MRRFGICLVALGLLFLAGCASESDTALTNDARANVPGAEVRNPQPAANGGWSW